MKRILPLVLLCISSISAANPSLTCPLPQQTMNVEQFKITPSGAVSTIKDQTGRMWSVYIYSLKKRVDKGMIDSMIHNRKNEQPRDAQKVFGAWMCKYEGGTKGVLFEGSSSYMAK